MLPFIVAIIIRYLCKADKEIPLSNNDRTVTKDNLGLAPADHGACIMESLSVIRSQATATNIYLEEIRNTLDSYKKRLDLVENRLVGVEANMEDVKKNTNSFKEYMQKSEDGIIGVQSILKENEEIVRTIMGRQMTMMAEVRLISLYKMTNQTSMWTDGGGGHGSGLAVDGQYVYSHWAPNTPVRTITHTDLEDDAELWVDLGALFRIYKVVVWNSRHGGMDRFIGTQIWADGRLLGAATSTKYIYEYKVAENDPVYARSVILKQTKRTWLHVSEVQVWGTGPFSEGDRFA